MEFKIGKDLPDKILNTEPENADLIRALYTQMEKGLNERADFIIEKKVYEFRRELTQNKSVAIAELLNSIDILTNNDPMSNSTNFNIMIRPRGAVKNGR